MSKKKNLEWICRRCIKQHLEAEIEHSTELLKTCSFCGTENWCFPVTLSRPVKGGKKAPKGPKMLKEVIDEARIANSEAIDTHVLDPETGTNTTDALVYDEIAPAETAPEAELAEETEAVEEVAEEALEEILAQITPQEEEPEETPLEAESEPTEEELAEAQRLVEVAELEAKLEALKK